MIREVNHREEVVLERVVLVEVHLVVVRGDQEVQGVDGTEYLLVVIVREEDVVGHGIVGDVVDVQTEVTHEPDGHAEKDAVEEE